jgi:hypothetical protein
MPIDPRIALGVQPLQVADPMARYSQLAGIQNAQNQNALAQYQLGSAQRTEKTQNLVADAYTKSTDPVTGIIDYNKLTGLVAAGGGGAQIPAIVKSRREGELAALTQREQQFKVEKSKSDFIAQAKRDTSQNPSDANLTAFKEDLIANPLFTAAEKTQYAANVDRILAMPVDQRRSFMASQGASAGELKPNVQTVNRGGQTDILNAPAFGGAPTTVGTYADVPLPANVFEQKKQIARSGASNIGFKQEAAFEGGLGKGQSERILANQVVAQDAAAILETNQVGRELLKSGAITGTGADFFVGFNNALKQAGVDFGYADAAANSQAYAAAMGANVGRIIKQFGAGTGLSDADREYAAQMAGGKISLTEASLRKILDINDMAANRVIDLHNKNVSGIKTNIPLTVDKPAFTQQKSAVDQIPGQNRSAAAPAIPPAAIDALKAGKGTDAEFDAMFESGTAKRAREGK